jgi:hypothetical protein
MPRDLMYAQIFLLGQFECSVLTGTRLSQIAQLFVCRVRVQDARKCTLYVFGGKSRLTLRVEAKLRALCPVPCTRQCYESYGVLSLPLVRVCTVREGIRPFSPFEASGRL